MKRKIVDFSIDIEGHWRAALECRHFQHVRHQPPLTVREWVTTKPGRDAKLGQELECKKCDGREQPDF